MELMRQTQLLLLLKHVCACIYTQCRSSGHVTAMAAVSHGPTSQPHDCHGCHVALISHVTAMGVMWPHP